MRHLIPYQKPWACLNIRDVFHGETEININVWLSLIWLFIVKTSRGQQPLLFWRSLCLYLSLSILLYPLMSLQLQVSFPPAPFSAFTGAPVNSLGSTLLFSPLYFNVHPATGHVLLLLLPPLNVLKGHFRSQPVLNYFQESFQIFLKQKPLCSHQVPRWDFNFLP